MDRPVHFVDVAGGGDVAFASLGELALGTFVFVLALLFVEMALALWFSMQASREAGTAVARHAAVSATKRTVLAES